jgi:UDP-glucose 4-epimerase
MAEMLLALTGSNQEIRYAPRSQATLVRNRIGSPVKAAREINFNADITLSDGLNRLIAWRDAHKEAVRQRRDRAAVL